MTDAQTIKHTWNDIIDTFNASYNCWKTGQTDKVDKEHIQQMQPTLQIKQ